jgi:gliding motility-associated-like protein
VQAEQIHTHGVPLQVCRLQQAVALSQILNGCSDSAVSTVSVSRPVIFDTIEVSGCDEVVYNGVIYSGSTTLIDTISSTVTVCDSIIRTVNIIVNPSPQITISPNQTICKGDSIVLRATAENASIFWQGIGTGDSIKVAPGLTTTYTAIATDTNGCANSAMVTIAVNDFDVQIAANPNPVIAGTTLQLQTSANSSYSILSWQPFFNNPIAYRQTWIADTSSMVKVVARSATGCIDTDSIYIIVDPLGDVFIPTAFTPNGDGRNDVFTIGGGNFKSFDLKIFNRWGQIVFQSNERSKGWDGRIDGKDALPGAYVYNLSCTLKDGKKINRSGTILLIR